MVVSIKSLKNIWKSIIYFIFQPIAEISKAISDLNRSRNSSGLFPILVHTDAAQTIGKVSVDVQQLQVDYLTVVGHKVILQQNVSQITINDIPKD